MAETEIKTKLTLSGDKEYRQGISDANRQLRVMKSQLQADTTALGNNASAQDKNALKAENLKKQIEAQKKIVELNKKRLEEVTKAYGENSKQADDMRIKYNNSRTALNSMQSALSDTKTKLDDVKKSSDDTGKSLEDSLIKNLAFNQAVEKFKTLGSVASSVLGGIKDLASEIVTGIQEIVTATAQTADDLMTQSVTSGLSVDTLSRLRYAYSMGHDVSVDTYAGAATKLQTTRRSAGDLFAEGGVFAGANMVNENGTLRSASNEEMMWNILQLAQAQITKNADGTLNVSDAVAEGLQTVFGKSWNEFNAYFANPAELSTYIADGLEKGLILDSEQWSEIASINDNLDRIRAIGEVIQQLFTVLFAENFQEITSNYGDMMEAIAMLEKATIDGDEEKMQEAKGKLSASGRGLVEAISGLINQMLTDLSDLLSGLAGETDAEGNKTTLASIAGFVKKIVDGIGNFDLGATLDKVIEFFDTLVDIVEKIARFFGVQTTASRAEKYAAAGEKLNELTGGSLSSAQMELLFDQYRAQQAGGENVYDDLLYGLEKENLVSGKSKSAIGDLFWNLLQADPSMVDLPSGWGAGNAGNWDVMQRWESYTDEWADGLSEEAAQTIAAALNGAKVEMDGYTVGQIVTPIVDAALAKYVAE